MRIAIDCRPIMSPGRGGMTGIGQYVNCLAKHLLKIDEENEYRLFFDDWTERGDIDRIVGGNTKAQALTLPSGRKRFLPYAFSHRHVATAIAKTEADVLHGTTGSLPLGYRGRSVITAHDLAIYLHPEWFPGGQFFSRKVVVPASFKRAAKIIAVSDSTARDAENILGVPSEKIVVIREGVERPEPDVWERPAPLGLARPYLLALGTIEPRKNIETLVAAYEILAERIPALVRGTELVIAGARGWKSDKAFAAIEAANRRFGTTGPGIRVLGYVPESDKQALIANALAFVFPSLYEGFGLPVLEAMALGVPVIASDRASVPEIAGRGAALLIDPTRPVELALAMRHLLEDERKREALGRRGLLRSTEFHWDLTAGKTLDVYEEAVRTPEA